MNGKVNAVTLGLANLYTNKVAGKLSGEISDIAKPIPFIKSGNSLSCAIPYTEAEALVRQGTNQVVATYYTDEFVASRPGLDGFTSFANSILFPVFFGGIAPWIRFSFNLFDGTILKIQFNSDESVTRINDETTGIAATQAYVQNTVAPVQAGVTALESNKVSLPMANSAPDYGTAGQFAVSDGNGGITWKTLVEAEGVDY